MGYIAVSYALYKIATPARYTVTLGTRIFCVLPANSFPKLYHILYSYFNRRNNTIHQISAWLGLHQAVTAARQNQRNNSREEGNTEGENGEFTEKLSRERIHESNSHQVKAEEKEERRSEKYRLIYRPFAFHCAHAFQGWDHESVGLDTQSLFALTWLRMNSSLIVSRIRRLTVIASEFFPTRYEKAFCTISPVVIIFGMHFVPFWNLIVAFRGAILMLTYLLKVGLYKIGEIIAQLVHLYFLLLWKTR